MKNQRRSITFLVIFILSTVFAHAQINSLKDYFSGQKFTIIGDSLNLSLNPEKYPLSANQYIIFFYTFKNIKAAKKIAFSGQTITIKKQDLEYYKGQKIPMDSVEELKIYYKNGSNTQFEAKFKINFVNQSTLKDDFALINLIYTNMNKSNDEKKDAMYSYFKDMYGHTKYEDLTEMINKIVK